MLIKKLLKIAKQKTVDLSDIKLDAINFFVKYIKVNYLSQ